MITFVLNETAFPFKNYLDLPLEDRGGYTHKSSTIIFKKRSPILFSRG